MPISVDKNSSGQIVKIELSPAQMAKLLCLTEDQLLSWKCTAPTARKGKKPFYRFYFEREWFTFLCRVNFLRRGVSEKHVEFLEESCYFEQIKRRGASATDVLRYMTTCQYCETDKISEHELCIHCNDRFEAELKDPWKFL